MYIYTFMYFDLHISMGALMYHYFVTDTAYLLVRGAFTYDVKCFGGIFDLPKYPNQILYYINLFSKIRSSSTYLPTYIPTKKSDVICECSLARFQSKVSLLGVVALWVIARLFRQIGGFSSRFVLCSSI